MSLDYPCYWASHRWLNQLRFAQLFNLSIASYTVPLQWKRASIWPVPKVINSQIFLISSQYQLHLYSLESRKGLSILFSVSIYFTPPPFLSFGDQYAFRPTGSPTSALITLLHTITNLLTVTLATPLKGSWPGLRDLTASSTYLFGSASLFIGFTVFILMLFCIYYLAGKFWGFGG